MTERFLLSLSQIRERQATYEKERRHELKEMEIESAKQVKLSLKTIEADSLQRELDSSRHQSEMLEAVSVAKHLTLSIKH